MCVEDAPGVLLVDDEPQILDVYERFLGDDYDVHVAASGEEALEVLTEEIQVVLLDRRMPGMSGDETLQAIRERDYCCRVAMVTAVTPETDIIEMGFEDYVVKPVTQPELRNVVDSLLKWDNYDDVLQRYFELAQKVAILEEEHPDDKLESESRYHELVQRLDNLKAEADDVLPDADSAAFKQVVDSVAEENQEGQSVEPPGDSS